ncbi:30S ribosomal protein S17 [Patescibacteria group bacterium]|nr:30S ribosomal protein S17 [Patescibacteria group bacterium]
MENKAKKIKGIVVSDKMNKTVVVSVSRFVKHPLYGKFYKVNKKFKAHDENNESKIGDKVEIIETRPISKDKRFKIVKK